MLNNISRENNYILQNNKINDKSCIILSLISMLSR